MTHEEHRVPHKIKVIVSKNLGKKEVVIGLEDLMAMHILHKDFPKTKWQAPTSLEEGAYSRKKGRQKDRKDTSAQEENTGKRKCHKKRKEK